VVYQDVTRQAKGLYHLKHVGTLRSGLVYLSRYNSGWFWHIHPQAVPKKQCLRRFAHDKREAIKREIAKLLVAGFIKEVIHPEWVANPVLVKKKNNEWRICVDYTDLKSIARRITSG
jgi:hypothetical protein